MKIQEREDGLFHAIEIDSDSITISVPFEKDSELYLQKIEDGFEVVEMTQAEKDAYKTEQERADIIAQIAKLDLPLYTLERALAGDVEAQDKIAANELEKQKLRALLK